MRKEAALSKLSTKQVHEIDLSISSIICSEVSPASFTEQDEKIYALNKTPNRKSHYSLTKANNKYRNYPMLKTICIDCEKKQKIITDLQIALQNDKSQIILTEKHLKQYDELLKIKDERLKETETALNLEKIEIEQQKIEISNIQSQLDNEQRKILREKYEIKKDLKELEQKKVELENLIQDYLGKKIEYLNVAEVNECEAVNNAHSILYKRDEEIQRLLDEASINKCDSVYEQRCFTLDDYSPKKTDEKLSLKKNRLKSLEFELNARKQDLIKEKQMQEKIFQEQMIKIKNREKMLEKEKLKIIEGQKLLQLEIQSINRIKSKLKFRFVNESESIQPEFRHHTLDLVSSKGSKTQENTIIICEGEESTQSKNMEKFIKHKKKISALKSIKKDLEQQLSTFTEQKIFWSSEKKSFEQVLESKNAEIADLKQKLAEFSARSQNSVNENMLKLKIGQLENLIVIEGTKLQSTIESLQKELKLCKETQQNLEHDNNELLNKCGNLEYEKEKFRKISESLHNQLNGINSDEEPSEESEKSEDLELDELKKELKSKLAQLKVQEDNLAKFEAQLKQEKTEISKAAEYIKNINSDLSQQRHRLEQDQVFIKTEKLRLSTLNKNLEEKNSMLAEKEKEIFNFKSKLEEREKLIHSYKVT